MNGSPPAPQNSIFGDMPANLAQRVRVVESMLSSIADFVYVFDLEGRFAFVNKALLDLWGLQLSDAVGKNFFDLGYPPELAGRLQAQIQQVIQTRQGLSDETPYTSPTGEGGIFEYIFAPAIGPDGEVEYVAGTTRDISRQHQAYAALQRSEDNFRGLAEKLRESEERASNIVESIADGFMTLDRDWHITYLNPRGHEVLQAPVQAESSLLGRVLWDAFPGAVGTVFEENYRRALQEQVTVTFEAHYPPLGIWVDVRAYPARHGLSIYFLDITERKQVEQRLRDSEQHFRLLADTLPQMVWVTRPDGYHEYYNRRWYEFTGMAEGSTDGDRWAGLVHAEDRERATAHWQQCLASGKTYEIEYRLRHHSGEYRWTLGRAMPVRNSHGMIERWFGTCTEIHAMKMLTEEREQLLESERAARTQAERAGRLKDDFLATLSHELRTPLGAILGWTYVLSSGKTGTEDLRRGLEVIERNARAQAQLIDDLLDMSRVISGKLRLEVQALDPVSFVEAAIETVMPAALAKDIRIDTALSPGGSRISGDADRLQQVVWNLLSNAIKFTPAGGHVHVRLSHTDGHVRIDVQDSGRGIEAEFLPHVFDRFRQADSSRSRSYGGLGLGLSIVKQLVELHGGTVSVASQGLNMGTTFSVNLPEQTTVKAAHDPASDDATPRVEAAPDLASASLAGIKILVVDDEPDIREIIRRVLANRDADVSVASSATEALALIPLLRPTVLISDIGMPEIDGYEFLRQVRMLDEEAGRDTPAVALTAFARGQDRSRALAAGYLAHVSKPVNPAQLLATIAAISRATPPRRG